MWSWFEDDKYGLSYITRRPVKIYIACWPGEDDQEVKLLPPILP